MPKTAVTSFFDIPTPLQCGKEANGLLYCWFVAEVLVAILIYKNKLSFSLCWELNSFFHAISPQRISLFCQPTWPSCHVVTNQEYHSSMI